MLSNNFEFIIASPFDREKLICEIYYKDEIFVEISQEGDQFMLEIYQPKKTKYWEMPLASLQQALERAKSHLLGC